VTHTRLLRRFGRDYLAPTWHPRALVDALAVVDAIRRPFLPMASAAVLPQLDGETIAIAKTDHLGDLIQATALFRALRVQLPSARLVLVHGSWARSMAEWLQSHDYVHELVEYDPAWLQPANRPWLQRFMRARTSRRNAAAALRAFRPALFLDIRTTSPHALTLAIESGAEYRVGFGLRGRAWQYHARIPYGVSQSIGQNWLHALGVLGLDAGRYMGPVLPAHPHPAIDAPIVLQPGSRTPGKEASLDVWHAIVDTLAPIAPLVLIGTAMERERYGALTARAQSGRVSDCFGATDIDALIRTIAGSRAVVGVESVGAHIGIGARRPVVVLDRAATSGRAAFPDACASLTFVSADQPATAVAQHVRAALTVHTA
jgi:ADP-heptose:LPS heptosyltransferase